MSMTKEEIIKELEKTVAGAEILTSLGYEEVNEYLDIFRVALSALRPITREQVENMWKGKWEPGNPICPICGKDKFDGLDADIWADWMPNFCPHCGAPMTDKALEITMKRMEEMRND